MLGSFSAASVASGPAIAIDRSTNNLGGAVVGTSVDRTSAFVIRNEGDAPLRITGLTESSPDFELIAVPADLSANPIVIAPGGAYSLGVRLKPSTVGLLTASISIQSNDPAHSVSTIAVDGVGVRRYTVGEWGNDNVAVSFPGLGEGSARRTTSDVNGNFEVFLPPDTRYDITVFDPLTGLVAHGQGVTPQSGLRADLTGSLTFKPSTSPDTDEDGLPDDIEYAIGTSGVRKDSDRDGLDGFTEIRQGLDPLGGLNIPVGIVSAAALQGSATAVAVAGSTTDPSQLTAYVATGSAGLAIQGVGAGPAGEVELFGRDVVPDFRDRREVAGVARERGHDMVPHVRAVEDLERTLEGGPPAGSEGFEVGRRHVVTLMRKMGITALYRKPKTSTPGSRAWTKAARGPLPLPVRRTCSSRAGTSRPASR